MSAAERNATCRRLVRAHLAERPGVAQSPKAIRTLLGPEADFTADEIAAACLFLADLGHLRRISDPVDARPFYMVTAAGTLAHEQDTAS